MCGTTAFVFLVCGTYCQYFPDGYLHSGTDAYFRAEDIVHLSDAYPDRTLDFE
jgi:hypothetical protein